MKHHRENKGFSNVQQESNKLKIMIRVRPFLYHEDENQFITLQDDNTLEVSKSDNNTLMRFNNILPPDSTQKDVFFLLEDSIKDFLRGNNVTIFAYGQTGSGKTYTMFGDYNPDMTSNHVFNFLSSKQRGILSRSLELVILYCSKQKESQISASFFQIYNEKVLDLFNYTTNNLEIRESRQGEISIPQLLNVKIENMESVIKLIVGALRNRSTRSMHGNIQSSRSHSIFEIRLRRRDKFQNIVNSTLRIVDLAGSEKFKISSQLDWEQKNVRIQELTSINTSLSCLGNCISALTEKTRKHIPFRNSKLTRILKDSLIGQGRLIFCMCISPSLECSAETLSTLQFANRVRRAMLEQQQKIRSNTVSKRQSRVEELQQLKKSLIKQKEERKNLEIKLALLKQVEDNKLQKENMLLRKQNQLLKNKLTEVGQNNHVQGKERQCNDERGRMYTIGDTKSIEDLVKKKMHIRRQAGLAKNKGENIYKEEMKNQRLQTKKKQEFYKIVNKFLQEETPRENNRAQQALKKQKIINHSQLSLTQSSEQSYKGASSKHRQFSILNSKSKRKDGSRSRSRSKTTSRNQNNLSSHNMSKSKNFACKTKTAQTIQVKSIGYKDSDFEATYEGKKNLQSKTKRRKKSSLQSKKLIQQVCQNLNLQNFNELMTEMKRAKHQLMVFKQKDQLLSQKNYFGVLRS